MRKGYKDAAIQKIIELKEDQVLKVLIFIAGLDAASLINKKGVINSEVNRNS